MFKFSLIVHISFLLCTASLCAQELLITNIQKSAQQQWTVNYSSHRPISSIQFVNSPDNSRSMRWQINEPGFEFRQLNSKETILRRDGQPFSTVSFTLTSNYFHLPKYYAPFSPFSDGSMLFHSGRFFACANLCSGLENLFYLSLEVPANDGIIFNGQLARNRISWYDKNDGQKIYVGDIDKVEHPTFYGVIDKGLPQALRTSLTHDLPIFFDKLNQRLFAASTKPMLFASFGQTAGNSYGRQGGVLPNQIFMHWYGQSVNEEKFDLLWFFAHEATHLFQGYEGHQIAPEDAWIHEGYADFIASRMLLEHYPEAKEYVDGRVSSAKRGCQASLKASKLDQLAKQGNYQALYHCGLVFYQTLLGEFEHTAEHGKDYQLWKDIGKYSAQERVIDRAVIMATVKPYTNELTMAEITLLLN